MALNSPYGGSISNGTGMYNIPGPKNIQSKGPAFEPGAVSVIEQPAFGPTNQVQPSSGTALDEINKKIGSIKQSEAIVQEQPTNGKFNISGIKTGKKVSLSDLGELTKEEEESAQLAMDAGYKAQDILNAISMKREAESKRKPEEKQVATDKETSRSGRDKLVEGAGNIANAAINTVAKVPGAVTDTVGSTAVGGLALGRGIVNEGVGFFNKPLGDKMKEENKKDTKALSEEVSNASDYYNNLFVKPYEPNFNKETDLPYEGVKLASALAIPVPGGPASKIIGGAWNTAKGLVTTGLKGAGMNIASNNATDIVNTGEFSKAGDNLVNGSIGAIFNVGVPMIPGAISKAWKTIAGGDAGDLTKTLNRTVLKNNKVSNIKQEVINENKLKESIDFLDKNIIGKKLNIDGKIISKPVDRYSFQETVGLGLEELGNVTDKIAKTTGNIGIKINNKDAIGVLENELKNIKKDPKIPIEGATKLAGYVDSLKNAKGFEDTVRIFKKLGKEVPTDALGAALNKDNSAVTGAFKQAYGNIANNITNSLDGAIGLLGTDYQKIKTTYATLKSVQSSLAKTMKLDDETKLSKLYGQFMLADAAKSLMEGRYKSGLIEMAKLVGKGIIENEDRVTIKNIFKNVPKNSDMSTIITNIEKGFKELEEKGIEQKLTAKEAAAKKIYFNQIVSNFKKAQAEIAKIKDITEKKEAEKAFNNMVSDMMGDTPKVKLGE